MKRKLLHNLLFCGFKFNIMSDDEDFTIDASTGDVLLHGEVLHNKSPNELMEAAIYRGIDVSKFKDALDTERAITSPFMFLLYHGQPLADTTWRLPKRAKVETPPNNRIVTVSRWESSVSSLEDSV